MKRNKILFKSFMSGVVALVMVLCFSVEMSAQVQRETKSPEKKSLTKAKKKASAPRTKLVLIPATLPNTNGERIKPRVRKPEKG